MSKRTSKHTIDEKVNIIRQVMANRQSIYSVSKQYQIDDTTLQNWMYQYKTYGIEGLKETNDLKIFV